MPYGISESQEDCSTWATVKQEADGSFTTIGCHELKQDAIDQMVVVSMAEEIDPLGQIDRALGDDPMIEDDPMNEDAPLNIFGEPVIQEDPTEVDAEEIALNPRQQTMYEATEAIVEEFGMFNQGSGADGSHYSPESPFMAEGLICGNCIFYEGGRACEVVEGEIAPEGICKLWIINENLLESKAIPLEEEPQEESSGYEARANVVSSWNEVIKMADTMQWIPKLVDESRSIAYSTMEVRAIGEGNSLVGYAAVFDSPSEPLPWIEYVRRGAFAKTLKDGADVRLLIDHEGVPLARSKSGTLTMEEDERGLKVQADLDPTNPDAARIISAMRRGDISQMSFAFRTVKDSWSADRTTRELKEVQLFDVSVVTFPAYEATVAELRSQNSSVSVAPSGSLRLRSAQIEIARRK